MAGRGRGRALFIATITLLLVCSSCQVTIATDIDARRDGSGVIRVGVGLDREALAEVPKLAEQLQVDDLRRVGWRITGPRRETDGLTWIRASLAFDTPAEAQQAVAQLNGPAGPFRGFALTRDGSVYRQHLRLTGVVDLSSGLEGFVDSELARRLGNANPGVDAATLKQRFGADLAELLKVRVSARLPGLVRSWQPRVGDPPLRLDASSASWNVRALGLSGAGALALLVGALTARGRRMRRSVTEEPARPVV